MPGLVLLDYIKMDQAERIRLAERARLASLFVKANKRPSALRSLLLAIAGG